MFIEVNEPLMELVSLLAWESILSSQLDFNDLRISSLLDYYTLLMILHLLDYSLLLQNQFYILFHQLLLA